jgi:hypothetical protein
MKHVLFTLLISTSLISPVFAADQAVIEETTPPVAEGALTPDQLPPVMTAIKQALSPTPEPPTQTR